MAKRSIDNVTYNKTMNSFKLCCKIRHLRINNVFVINAYHLTQHTVDNVIKLKKIFFQLKFNLFKKVN